MIQNPVILIAILLSIEIFILFISGHERFRKYFKFLPPVFWIYFLPMLASTAGLIDAKSPIYQKIIANFLPASLFLLLMTVDIRSIMRLGAPALIMFFAGAAGIVLGTPVVFYLFKDVIGPDFWAGFGALSASWTGGSANMIAVKEALNTPDAVFTPMVIVDTIVPYVWMGILVAMVRLEPAFDKWNRADRRVLDDLNSGTKKSSAVSSQFQWRSTLLILCLAALGSFAAQKIAVFFPVIKDVISTYAWTIIIVSMLGIALSFTPLRRLEKSGSNKIGYFILYFVLTAIGAKASLSDIGSTFILILAGFLIVLIHAAFLLIAARIVKTPLFLVAVASQANVGGVASAPVVAEIYQPGLASVGLLLAILGNIIGTYLGIVAGQLCRWAANIGLVIFFILMPFTLQTVWAAKENAIKMGMSAQDFYQIYPKRKARTLRESDNELRISYNRVQGKSAGTITYYFKNDKLIQWRVNDRAEIIQEYLSEFASGDIIQGQPLIRNAIFDVFKRLPMDVFLKVTDRRRPVIFIEFYDVGTARFAGSLDFYSPEDHPLAFQNGFTVIKLGTALNTSNSQEAITGVVAHELAHRVLEHSLSPKKSCDMEREANRMIIKWGFKKEYQKAREKLGHKEGDSKSCEED